MRQLYQACVAPVVDYASTVWHNPLKDKTHLRALGTVQRTALIRVLSAFKTVATQTLEVEAYTLPTLLRLKQRAQTVVARLCTLPSSHPMHSVMARAKKRSCNVRRGPRFPLAEILRTMDLKRLDTLETIDPRPLAPWDPPVFEDIIIDSDRDEAEKKAMALIATQSIIVYSDASADQNHVGAAAVVLDHDQMMIEHQKISIGSKTQWSIHAAELIGIYCAIGIISNNIFESRGTSTPDHGPVIIMSDSKSALQAITNPASRSGQQIIYSILKTARHLKTQGVALRLQWIPGHCDNPGNDAADRLAKEAVGSGKMHPFQNLVSREKAFYRDKIRDEWEGEWKRSQKGGHLRRIDGMLPSIRARRLYDTLPRNRAYLLTQLRTGHSWLATHAKRRKLQEDDKCECGAIETVVHVLVDCPKLINIRQKLRKEIGDAFNDISIMLGGRGQGKQKGKGISSAQHSTLSAVLDFAEASHRFLSRVPRQPGQHRP